MTNAADEFCPTCGPADLDSILAKPYRMLVIGIFASVFLVAFEAIAVATAMPIVVRSLDGMQSYAWAFTAFFVTSLVATVAAGELADRHGPRVPLYGGIGLFVVGLIIAGSAQTMWELIAGRAVQGLGSGGVIVALYVVVGWAFPPHLRPRAFAVLSSAWVLPSIIGPVIAGSVAEHLNWRFVFLGLPPLVIPAALLMIGPIRRLQRPLDDPDAEITAGVRGSARVRLALGTAAGVALLQFAGQHLEWWSLGVAIVGVAVLAPTVRKLLPAGAFLLRRGLPTTVLMRGFFAGAFFGAEAFVPLMLVTHRGLSATLAGMSLTGAALGWATGSWWQGRPRTTIERPRLVQLGAALVAVAIAGVTVAVNSQVPVWVVAISWLIGGLGMGVSMSSLSVLVLEQSPGSEQGANSAALQISDAMCSVIFVGVGGAILAAAGGSMDGTASSDPGGSVFATIFAVMIALAIFTTIVAVRIRQPSVEAPTTEVAERVA